MSFVAVDQGPRFSAAISNFVLIGAGFGFAAGVMAVVAFVLGK